MSSTAQAADVREISEELVGRLVEFRLCRMAPVTGRVVELRGAAVVVDVDGEERVLGRVNPGRIVRFTILD